MDSKTFTSAKYGELVVSHKLMGIWRQFWCPTVITKDEAAVIQAELGYAPQGYGFDHFKINANGTTWKCYHSCD